MESNKERFRYLIILIIYLIAAAIGVAAALLLPFSLWLNILIADVISTVTVFIFSLIFHNASVYDPYWSVQPIVIVIALACAKQPTVTLILPLIAIIIWGIRLTANWAYVFYGLDHKFQDWRYTMFEEKTGKLYFLVNFTGIHLFPTLVVFACMLPVIFTYEVQPQFNVWSVIFFVFSLCAVFIEGLADCTKHKFRHDGGTGFIRKGIWKYSRHPNYLGEISFWWGIALGTVLTMPDKWWLIVGAFINTLMFLFVSIPMADKHQSRKEGFALYKTNTRMLLPIYKKQR